MSIYGHIEEGYGKFGEGPKFCGHTGQCDCGKLVTKSGASRSNKAPRYDLIPHEGLRRLADRYGLGAKEHGEGNWKKGLRDPDFIREAKNHLMDHFYAYLSDGNAKDDNLAAVAWGAFFLMEAEKVAKEDEAASELMEKHLDASIQQVKERMAWGGKD